WQVHVQSVRAPRRFVRHVAIAYPLHLSKFFPAGKALAIHRYPARTRRCMSDEKVAVLDLAPAHKDFREQVLAGLAQRPRMLPCKFFYDEVGSTLFSNI